MMTSEYLLHCVLLMLMSAQGYGHILRLPCKRFADFRTVQKNHALEDGWVIQTIENTNVRKCQSECLKNNKCKSFNSYNDGSACELNSRSANDVQDDVKTVPRSGWTYHSTSYKDALIGHTCRRKNPCPGKRCMDTCGYPGYQCSSGSFIVHFPNNNPAAATAPCNPATTTTPCPPVTTQVPTTTTKEKAITTQAPTTVTKEKVVTTQAPITATKEHVVTTQAPTTATKEKVVTSQAPITATKEKVVTTQVPTTSTKEKAITTQAPTTATKENVETSQAPTTATKEKAVITLAPTTATKEKPVTTQAPTTATKEKPVITLAPTTATKENVVTSQAPTTATKEKAITTQAPTTATKEKAVTTQVPTTATKEKPVITQAPITATKEKTVTTQAPTTAMPTQPVTFPITGTTTPTKEPGTTPVTTTVKKPCKDPCKFHFCAGFPQAFCKRSKEDKDKPEFFHPNGTKLEIKDCGTKCSDKCIHTLNPHCGSDGVTYRTLCMLNVAKCRSKGTLTLLYRGHCRSNCIDPCAFGSCPKNTAVSCRRQEKNQCEAQFLDHDQKDVTAQCEDDCGLRPDPGQCSALVKSWYFDKEERECKRFQYGGCGGNKNRFNTEKECMRKCKNFKGTKCGRACFKIYFPHCASDGINRGNGCVMNSAICRSNGLLGRRHVGDCVPCKPCVYNVCAKYPQAECRPSKKNRCQPEFFIRGATPAEDEIKTECGDICGFYADAGPDRCRKKTTLKWFYNKHEKRCKRFGFSGCGGNENKFNTEKECMQMCGKFNEVCSYECPDHVDEYCGTGGETFKNLCYLNVAKCFSRGTLGLKHKGACRPKEALVL